MLYFPMLRTKKGELNALTTLKPMTINVVRPILQVPPPELDWDGNRVSATWEYVTKVANALQSVLSFDNYLKCYLDVSAANLNSALLSDLLFGIARYGGIPRPVFSLTGAEEYAQLHRQLIGIPKKSIIRVTLNEMTGRLMRSVKTALLNYQLDEAKTFVMLDMGDISDEKLPINLYETAIVGAVSQLARLNLAGIILTSTALPTSVLTVPKWKPTYFVRREVEIFKRVCTDAEYDLHFGDYATGSVDIEPTTIRLGSPKARYTLPTKYEVYKGEKTGRSPNTMAEQYQRISEHLVKQPEYSGADFSWGDDFIYQASLPGNHPRGNATTWVTVNTSHHIEMVVSMLPSMKYDF